MLPRKRWGTGGGLDRGDEEVDPPCECKSEPRRWEGEGVRREASSSGGGRHAADTRRWYGVISIRGGEAQWPTRG